MDKLLKKAHEDYEAANRRCLDIVLGEYDHESWLEADAERRLGAASMAVHVGFLLWEAPGADRQEQ